MSKILMQVFAALFGEGGNKTTKQSILFSGGLLPLLLCWGENVTFICYQTLVAQYRDAGGDL